MPPGPWTEIRESQDGFNGKYFVGYDRDKSQFLMIDADDPALIAYFTEGWSGEKLVLRRQMGKINSNCRIAFNTLSMTHIGSP